jgi:polyphenol oxidase
VTGQAAAADRTFALCDGVLARFTGRPGGVSSGPFVSLNLDYRVGDDPASVTGNRDRLLQDVGPGPRRLNWMRQVHGTGVIYVGAHPEPGMALHAPDDHTPEADAAFTDSPSVALCAMAADCAPVLLADPAAGLVGAAHAGRQGMAAGVVPALVAAMSQAGADPARMHAVIGPAICGQCYEVPAAMRDEVAATVPESAAVTRQGTPGIDIRAGIRAQLTALRFASVSDDARCTAESEDLFSYRRDGQTGRFAGLVWLAP